MEASRYMFVCTLACVYVGVHVLTHVCVCACMCVCVCVLVCVCVCVFFVCKCVYIHVYAHTLICVYMCVLTCSWWGGCMCSQRPTLDVFLNHCPFYFSDRIFHWAWNSSIWLVCLSSKPKGPTCLYQQGLQHALPHPDFPCGPWENQTQALTLA